MSRLLCPAVLTAPACVFSRCKPAHTPMSRPLSRCQAHPGTVAGLESVSLAAGSRACTIAGRQGRQPNRHRAACRPPGLRSAFKKCINQSTRWGCPSLWWGGGAQRFIHHVGRVGVWAQGAHVAERVSRSPALPAPSPSPARPVLFAVCRQGRALGPRTLGAHVGVPAGHDARRQVVLWKTRPWGEQEVTGPAAPCSPSSCRVSEPHRARREQGLGRGTR